ncbi:MAG: glycosyltransferase [Nostocales cyanobacterium 94392]|nr:glycosyltransferase [Nostocales cyanobacterium 94392]
MEISYVVPTLNSVKTLEQTLLSLKSQNEIDINIIVIDSGSKDGTLDICKKWQVKVLYCEPGNMYKAINIGLSECKTSWLAYLNSDDWLYPDATSRLLTLGISQNAQIVYGNCDYTDFQGRFLYSFTPPKPQELISVVRGGNIGFAQQTTIFTKEIYEKLIGFNEEYRLAADREFFVRALLADAKFSFLPGPSVACFRLHKAQLSHTHFNEITSEGKKIIDFLSGNPNIYDRLIRLKWRADNLPNYALRILRQSILTRKIVFAKSKDSGSLTYDF